MTKENNQLLDSGSAQLLLGVMTLLYTVQRTVAAYDVVVDNVVNAQTTLLVGIAAQALESSNNAAQQPQILLLLTRLERLCKNIVTFGQNFLQA